MPDSDMAIAGVQSCGCITYVNSRPEKLNQEDRRAISRIIEKGSSIRRDTVGAIKADPNFMHGECPHDPKGWEKHR